MVDGICADAVDAAKAVRRELCRRGNTFGHRPVISLKYSENFARNIGVEKSNGHAMGQLSEGLIKVEQAFRLRVITPEFEIILRLYERGPTPSAALRSTSRASSAAFSLILKRLVGADILQVEHDAVDRRVRKYDLTGWARAELDSYAQNTVREVVNRG